MWHYLKATAILQFLGLLPCSVYSKTTLWLLPSADYYFSSLKVTPRLIADWHTDYSHSFSDTQTTPIHTQTLRLLPFSHRLLRLLPFSHTLLQKKGDPTFIFKPLLRPIMGILLRITLFFGTPCINQITRPNPHQLAGAGWLTDYTPSPTDEHTTPNPT